MTSQAELDRAIAGLLSQSGDASNGDVLLGHIETVARHLRRSHARPLIAKLDRLSDQTKVLIVQQFFRHAQAGSHKTDFDHDIVSALLLEGLNVNEPGWPDNLNGERIFNYTCGFGLLREVQILQEYISGVDVTVPIVGRQKPHCLPAVVLTMRQRRPTHLPLTPSSKPRSPPCAPTSTWPHGPQAELYRMAEAAYQFTDQRDYSRVDCRVTPDGRCYFLEVNANPAARSGQGVIRRVGRPSWP